MKAFITGISGFVGGHLAEHLTSCGDEVVGSTRRASGDAIHIRWDLTAPGPLPQIEQFAPNCIYHLAAISVPQDCGDRGPTERAWAVNVEGTRRVLRLAATLPRRPRVLVVSTRHVYAPPQRGFVVDEDAPLGPTTAYGQTKLAAEQAAGELAAELDLDVVIARPFQHTGPGQREPMMLPQWSRQFAVGSDPVRVYNLDTMIDLTDVRDVVRAYRLLIERGRSGTVYNVGSGSRQRTGDLFAVLQQIADPARRVHQTHPGPARDPIADISRLIADTGWYPRIPIAQTIADTFTFWRGRVLTTIE